ncbi:MAG: glycosyltransferase family 2 protein [Planctomycetia bacterium]|nr:glycosyltransferase family 2 protein [Planctomycetia bacterium]
MGIPRVTVVVVNFNGGTHVLRCLEGLAAQARPPDAVVLLDNASTDGSLLACRTLVAAEERLASRTRIEPLPVNIGFAAACNRGLVGADTEFVALLNPDAVAETAWLEQLLQAADRHPHCAAFGCRQMRDGQPGILDGIGDRYHVSGLAWREAHGRRLRDDDLVPREIFSACAAAALYRRAAVVAVGGFDEGFFCYCEDVDLGFRLRLAGHHAWYVPDAVVHHVGGVSSGGPASAAAAYYGHRNLVWAFVKNMPAPLLACFLPAHLLHTMIAWVRLARRGQGRLFVRSKWDALRGLADCWRKRQVVQASRTATLGAIWRVLDKGLPWSR